jgi:AmmeMemoRadiSam system radical SAM enzyme
VRARRGDEPLLTTYGRSSGFCIDLEKAREEFFSAMDATNIDLKAFTEGFYQQLCSTELGPVFDTLEYVKRETSVWLEITTLLIPGCDDAPSEIAALSGWVASRLGLDVPLHFSAFHPDWKMHDVPATPRETLTRAREIAKNAGLRYVYTGNVHDEAGQSTYCPPAANASSAATGTTSPVAEAAERNARACSNRVRARGGAANADPVGR